MSSAPLKACVIGWPIEHSRSPLIHNYWLEQYAIAGSYEKVAVRPGQLGRFVASLQAAGYAGCNVTIPHKQAVMQHVDEIDPVAERIGAVNTIWLEEGRRRATNTDIYGFLANLDEHAPGWDKAPGKAAILGAGGAARAVVVALHDRGFSDMRMVNRTEEKVAALAKDLSIDLQACSWSRCEAALAGCSLLVNTTSLGMTGEPPLEISLDPLPAGAAVCDIVYSPLETRLLRDATRLGFRAVDGLGMLLHQAAPGFEHWFGKRPEVSDALRRLVIQDIQAGA